MSIKARVSGVATLCGDNTFVTALSVPAFSGLATRVTTIPSVSRLPKGNWTRTPGSTKALSFSGTA